MPKAAKAVPAKAIREVKKEVVSKFPEMKGVKPNVVKRRVPPDSDLPGLIQEIDGELGAKLAGMKYRVSMRELYCASFEKKVKTERGTLLSKIVRVTFDEEGHILKLVSSK